jgi:hypothetical protein
MGFLGDAISWVDKATNGDSFLGQTDTLHDIWDLGAKTVLGGVDQLTDVLPKGLGEQAKHLDALDTGPNATAKKGLGGLGFGLDLINVGKGSYNFTKGMNEDGFSDDDTWSGIHDLLSGGSGGLGYALEGTPAGALLSSFSTGMAIGDLMAPVIFGDKDENASKQDEDGVWHPSTGNSFIDEGLADFGIDAVDKSGSLLGDALGLDDEGTSTGEDIGSTVGQVLDVVTTANPIGLMAEAGDALTDAIGVGDVLPSLDEVGGAVGSFIGGLF